MPAKFATVAGLAGAIEDEAKELYEGLEAALGKLGGAISGTAATSAFDEVCTIVTRLKLLGVDLDDPLPGKEEA